MTNPTASTPPPSTTQPGAATPGETDNMDAWCEEAWALLTPRFRERFALRDGHLIYVDDEPTCEPVRVEIDDGDCALVFLDASVLWEWREATDLELRAPCQHPWVVDAHDELVSELSALGFEEAGRPDCVDDERAAILGEFLRRCQSSEDLARALESVVDFEFTHVVEPPAEMNLESLQELAGRLLRASVVEGVMTESTALDHGVETSVTSTYDLGSGRLSCRFPFPAAEDEIEAELHSLEFDATEMGLALELTPAPEGPQIVTLTASPKTPVDLYELMERAWRVARRSHRLGRS